MEFADEATATVAKDALHNFKIDGETKMKVGPRDAGRAEKDGADGRSRMRESSLYDVSGFRHHALCASSNRRSGESSRAAGLYCRYHACLRSDATRQHDRRRKRGRESNHSRPADHHATLPELHIHGPVWLARNGDKHITARSDLIIGLASQARYGEMPGYTHPSYTPMTTQGASRTIHLSARPLLLVRQVHLARAALALLRLPDGNITVRVRPALSLDISARALS